MATEISKMKDVFNRFETIINDLHNTNFNIVNLNKAKAKDRYYDNKQSKGVLHDFVRIYEQTIKYVFLFSGDIKTKDLKCRLVIENDKKIIDTDYMLIDDFKKSLKTYMSYIETSITFDIFIDDSILIPKFFPKNDVKKLIIDDLHNTLKHTDTLKYIVIEEKAIDDIKKMKDDCLKETLDKIDKHKLYKKVESLRVELTKAENMLDKHRHKAMAKYNIAHNSFVVRKKDLQLYKIKYNKKIELEVEKTNLSPIEKTNITKDLKL